MVLIGAPLWRGLTLRTGRGREVTARRARLLSATRTLTRDPQTKSIPVVMITTKDQETDRIWGMRQGAVDYLVKPVTEAVLVAKAQEVLERGSND